MVTKQYGALSVQILHVLLCRSSKWREVQSSGEREMRRAVPVYTLTISNLAGLAKYPCSTVTESLHELLTLCGLASRYLCATESLSNANRSILCLVFDFILLLVSSSCGSSSSGMLCARNQAYSVPIHSVKSSFRAPENLRMHKEYRGRGRLGYD